MSKTDDYKIDLSGMREKTRSVRETDIDTMYRESLSWKAVSELTQTPQGHRSVPLQTDLNLSGKILRGGKYTGEKLAHTNFSGADLKETNFVQADLQGADFSGADLSGADLSGANLNGAVFSGAKLRGTNFTGAKMNAVVLVDADIQDAILLDVEMDQLALDELQSLVEYLAVYYPHKLNLSRMNLTLLDFTKIDLSRVNLRGVDFTGVDFTGVNIFELDLSECIISPEQIAQALGRMPTPLELKRILAPKNKKQSKFKGIDFEAFFHSTGPFGVLDLTKDPGISIKDILAMGKKIYRAVIKTPDPKDEEILAQFQHKHEEKQDAVAKEHNTEVRKIIEERKKEMLQNKTDELREQMTRTDRERQAEKDKAQQLEKQEMLRSAKEKYQERQRAEQKKNRNAVQERWEMAHARGQRERGG